MSAKRTSATNDEVEPKPGEPPPWRRRTRMAPEERRSTLLQAAAQVITEHGFDNLTMEAITDRAGVSKALGYFYFNRLEELLHELFTREFEAIYVRLVPALTEPGTLEERIRRKVAAYFDVVGERQDLFSRLNTHLKGPEFRRERQERFRLWEEYVAGLIESEWEVSEGTGRLLARLLMVVDERCVNIWLRDEMPREVVEEICVQFQLAGLRQVLDPHADSTGEPGASIADAPAKKAPARKSSAKRAQATKAPATKAPATKAVAKKAAGSRKTGSAKGASTTVTRGRATRGKSPTGKAPTKKDAAEKR